eukprot:TRINITY_DN3572_c0_g1_i5.p2 TRINITY_DN3572_c0_g1~~TRINITY_DN3572_c0_g1_i5.p2  ORF type:complete len:294 (+),score=35.87 TRINITY_DN3572_c0_g1_i5:68-949(+)
MCIRDRYQRRVHGERHTDRFQQKNKRAKEIAMNWDYILRTFRTNKCYLYYCSVQLVLALLILIYILLDPKHNSRSQMVFWCEGLLTLVLFFDVFTRLFVQKQSKWNLIDLGTLIAIFLLMLFLIWLEPITTDYRASEIINEEDVFEIAVIGVRYLIQLLRIGFIIKSTADAHKMTKYANEDIKFNLEMQKKSDDPHPLEINDTLQNEAWLILQRSLPKCMGYERTLHNFDHAFIQCIWRDCLRIDTSSIQHFIGVLRACIVCQSLSILHHSARSGFICVCLCVSAYVFPFYFP